MFFKRVNDDEVEVLFEVTITYFFCHNPEVKKVLLNKEIYMIVN